MSDKEFGRRCQQCNKTGGDTFARMYYEPIDGKWLRLCGVCWVAVEHSVQPDGGVCTCKKPIATTSTQNLCGNCGKPRRR